MSEAKKAPATGVVCGASGDKAKMEAFLAARGYAPAKWYTPGELHDLDRDVRRGRVDHVVFAGLPDLLVGIWEEEIEFGTWPAEVGVEFVAPPGDQTVQLTEASWQQWRRQHRRRQALAGGIVSAIVLAAAFVLCVVLAK
jgi:hypothetical protein